MSIYCYTVQGVLIDVELHNTLFEISFEMFLLHVTPIEFDVTNCKGQIWTDFKVGRFGSMCGMVYTAEVAKGLQAGHVRYLVNTFDLIARSNGQIYKEVNLLLSNTKGHAILRV
jgi:hypothetical protein